MAMPSTATSWVAANALVTNPTAINGASEPASKGVDANTRSDTVSPHCANRTHGLRNPMGGNVNRSMNGPATSLKAHGIDTTDVNNARSPTLASRSASHAGMATISNPSGTPCAK